jgi:hypothetical protein
MTLSKCLKIANSTSTPKKEISGELTHVDVVLRTGTGNNILYEDAGSKKEGRGDQKIEYFIYE